jgi:hypothetical protein
MTSSIEALRRGTWPHVSVIMAVRNEARRLNETVDAVLAQRYPGRLDVTIAAAPSDDDTGDVARKLAEDDRVTVVDGHAVIPLDYVRRAVELLDETGADNVGGIMAAEGVTPFEQAVGAAMSSRFGTGDARFHYGGSPGPVDTVYLGTFRRSALERVGGYDETLVRTQDSELNLRLRETGGTVWFSPDLRVRYRPRGSLRALATQYFQYGQWRRVVARRHPGSLRCRQVVAPVVVTLCAGGAVIAATGRQWGLIPIGVYASAIAVASVVVGRRVPAGVALRLPAVFLTMHTAWALGFLTSPRWLGRTHARGPYTPLDDG